MEAEIRWIGGATFVGESGSGHAVVIDGPPDAGGRDIGVRPMEMLLLGLGSCSAFDVVDILRKGREPVRDCVVRVEAERADTPPRVFTRIHLHYTVYGPVRENAVQRAVDLSAEKYCSASVMLAKTAAMTREFHIVDADPPR